MILGGFAAGFGIRDSRRRHAGSEGDDASHTEGENAEGNEKLGLTTHD